MADKHRLRVQRAGTVINLVSSKQESELATALKVVAKRLSVELAVELHHEREWKLIDVCARLEELFPEVEFTCFFKSSTMRPDGGILSVKDKGGVLFPILIVEVKNQGTNDLRRQEGKPKQAKGNAIERLGKNVIGFRTAMLSEGINPFVCFGYGCDFHHTSSILDRVVTIAMFGPLNQIHLANEGTQGQFNRGSFFFQEESWSAEAMSDVMWTIAERSVYYYFAKYGKDRFVQS